MDATRTAARVGERDGDSVGFRKKRFRRNKYTINTR